jgi:hypothetical protein|tara:strand:+ start:1225 stop:1548 length:324 start_codon:yes stop_codon:yes gene_type:complete
MKRFKTFSSSEIVEVKGVIANTKPDTLEDAENPEIQVAGFGRMRLSNLKSKLVKDANSISTSAKRGDWNSVQGLIDKYQDFLTAHQEIEQEMSSPAYKRKITKLKRR